MEETKYKDVFDIILNIAIVKKANIATEAIHNYSTIGSEYYTDVKSWVTDNISNIEEVEDDKGYVNWKIDIKGGKELNLTIHYGVLKYIGTKCNDFKHAKNVFLKYVTCA